MRLRYANARALRAFGARAWTVHWTVQPSQGSSPWETPKYEKDPIAGALLSCGGRRGT